MKKAFTLIAATCLCAGNLFAQEITVAKNDSSFSTLPWSPLNNSTLSTLPWNPLTDVEGLNGKELLGKGDLYCFALKSSEGKYTIVIAQPKEVSADVPDKLDIFFERSDFSAPLHFKAQTRSVDPKFYYYYCSIDNKMLDHFIGSSFVSVSVRYPNDRVRTYPIHHSESMRQHLSAILSQDKASES